MGIIAWIILGALSGWIASIIMDKNASMGAIANIVTGIVGAFIGGIVSFLSSSYFSATASFILLALSLT